MGVLPSYCTREEVKIALDFNETARNDIQVDRAIESASRTVERRMHRVFYPRIATRYFDWPDIQSPTSWRLWLDENELISVTTLISGGTEIANTDYFLEPINSGPPYNRLEVDLASSASFVSGDTPQRNISIAGLWGYDNNTAPAGALAEALDATETDVDVTDSGIIGIGDLITVGTEKMIVTEKTLLDTGINSTASLTASAAATTVTVSSTVSFNVNEEIAVESERMFVVAIASATTLTVKRAYNGSVLAAHTTPFDVYAPRTLTVERGVLGTTAAIHDTATAITRQIYPGPIRTLTLAEALNIVAQEQSSYARQVGLGELTREATAPGLEGLRKAVYGQYGRRNRLGVV